MTELKVTDRRWWARGEDAAPAEEAKLKPRYVEELEQAIATKDLEIQQLIARYKGVERGRRSLLAAFLDVLDNLDRALAAAADRADDPLVQGVALVRQQFLATLDGFGVTRIEPLGQMFDPALHEAVTMTQASAATPDGQIVGVIRPGYRIGDDVLRPAQVAVAR
jgi:molecular chaperone GrpE